MRNTSKHICLVAAVALSCVAGAENAWMVHRTSPYEKELGFLVVIR